MKIMMQPSEPSSSEAVETFKALVIIGIAAGLGALLAYGSARFFGYGVTLIAILLTLFLSLSFASTVVEAIIPTMLLGVLGYVALHHFPQFLPIGGVLSGIAMTMAFATYKEEEEG